MGSLVDFTIALITAMKSTIYTMVSKVFVEHVQIPLISVFDKCTKQIYLAFLQQF